VKRWFAILFLSFFALNFAGIYIYFAFRLVHIRQEMRAALRLTPDDQLTRMELTVDAFYRSRVDENEIQVNGRMYDIARITYQHKKVIVYCLHDEAEDSLLAFLDAVSNRAHQDTIPVPQSIQQFLSLTFLISEFHFMCLPTATASPEITYLVPAYTTELPVPCPPPQKTNTALS
jgi:hypothetical protein